MICFAQGLVLKQRHNITQEWPITKEIFEGKRLVDSSSWFSRKVQRGLGMRTRPLSFSANTVWWCLKNYSRNLLFWDSVSFSFTKNVMANVMLYTGNYWINTTTFYMNCISNLSSVYLVQSLIYFLNSLCTTSWSTKL